MALDTNISEEKLHWSNSNCRKISKSCFYLPICLEVYRKIIGYNGIILFRDENFTQEKWSVFNSVLVTISQFHLYLSLKKYLSIHWKWIKIFRHLWNKCNSINRIKLNSFLKQYNNIYSFYDFQKMIS